MKPLLLYALHSGQLYGTERMALATLEGLRETFEPRLLAPPGPVLAEAERRGLPTVAFSSRKELLASIRTLLAQNPRVAFAATAITHSLAYLLLNAWYRRPGMHIHLVHGGTDERDSYGRKRLLNRTGVRFVAVSAYVRERLLAHGVRADKIDVIENFLSPDTLAERPRRTAFTERGLHRVLIVSRVDPIKRIDLLLDCLDLHPELRGIEFRVLGTGWDLERLRQRAAADHPNVTLVGYSADVPAELARSDLLLHLCPTEPFGLAILEAMAADVPVLVPDRGGAGSLVEHEGTGLRFQANDPEALATALQRVAQASPDSLNGLVANAREQLATRFAAPARVDDYRRLLLETRT